MGPTRVGECGEGPRRASGAGSRVVKVPDLHRSGRPASATLEGLAGRKEIVEACAAVLAPYMGPTLSGASLRGHCDKLGIGEDDVSAHQLDALLAAMRPGLHVFVGEEKTSAIIREMRRAIESIGGRS